MTRKLNLNKQEVASWIDALVDYLEDGETIEVTKNNGKFTVSAPDEVINSYEDDL